MLSPASRRPLSFNLKSKLRHKFVSATLRIAPRPTREARLHEPPASSPAADFASRKRDPPAPKESTYVECPNILLPDKKLTAQRSVRTDIGSKAWTKLPFPVEKLQYRWETLTPTEDQLKYANKVFTRRKPEFLWSAPKFQSMSFGDSPEICVLGRSNIGKSSLLNALFGREVAHSSSKPGRTSMMNAFGVRDAQHEYKNRLVVLDMPGYGYGGQAAWGKEILKYLSKRPQLMRAFLLIDSEHGLKRSDEQILALFRKQNIPHQIVFSKVDKFLFPSGIRLPSESLLQKRFEELYYRMQEMAMIIQPDQDDECGALGEILACSSEYKINGYRIGIDLVRHAMLQSAEIEFQRPKKKPVEGPEIVSFDQIPGIG